MTTTQETLVERVDTAVRVAVWNAAKARGMSQEASIDLVDAVLNDRAILALTPPIDDITYAGAEVVPEGWRLVPVEPTEAMKQAGELALDVRGLVVDHDDAADAWVAMLAAAPSPES